MKTLRQLGNQWVLWTMAVVLACSSNALAQQSYKVTDLGHLYNWNLGCAMGLNAHGWTEIMEGNLVAGEEDSATGKLLIGRAAVDIEGTKLDLGTLGGKNSWTNYGGINNLGQAVGYAETNVPDPNGEDICGFGTGLTCRPFLWQVGRMTALPTLGGNNGQASAINNHGQVAGWAENTIVDPTCPPAPYPPNRITKGVVWEKGNAQALPPLGSDPDTAAFGINDRGEAVGYSGTCTSANHAVIWKNGIPTPLPDLGVPGASEAFAISDSGMIIGIVASPNGQTYYAAIWDSHNTHQITNLGTLPGDVNSLGEGINNRGQAVGSTLNSSGNWSHAFLWQNGTMIDLNTLFPASSNLYATMANQINDEGQVSGMAVVLSGPHAGEVHAFLATPVDESIDQSMADAVSARPDFAVPANPDKRLAPRIVGRGQSVR